MCPRRVTADDVAKSHVALVRRVSGLEKRLRKLELPKSKIGFACECIGDVLDKEPDEDEFGD